MHRHVLILQLSFALSACQAPPWLDKAPETPPPVSKPEKAKPAPVAEKPAPAAPVQAPPTSRPAAVDKPEAALPAPAAPVVAKKRGEDALRDGQLAYGNGDYDTAARHFDYALTVGVAKRSDRIKAWKYLAFIACAKEQQTACRYYFQRMLTINPKAELDVTERGHPLWGPIFIEVQEEIRRSKPGASKGK